MKRGQASMDFLMTYCWGLLAMLISISAWAYYTGNFPGVSPATCELETPFACVEYKVVQPAVAGNNGTLILGIVATTGTRFVNITVDCLHDGTASASNSFSTYLPQNTRVNGTYVYLSCPLPDKKLLRSNLKIDYILYNQNVMHTSKGSLISVIEKS